MANSLLAHMACCWLQEQLFSVAWNPDIPFLFALGGKGTLKTLSALKFDGVHRKFNPEAPAEEPAQ